MLGRLILTRYSTTISSSTTCWNNNLVFESGRESMFVYLTNPSLLISGSDIDSPLPGSVGMNLVETKSIYVRGAFRLNFRLGLYNMVKFISHDSLSDQLLLLVTNSQEAMDEQRLDIKNICRADSSTFTFFNVNSQSISNIRSLNIAESQLVLLRNLMSGALYQISGMGLTYSSRYDQIVDQIVQGSQQQSHQIEQLTNPELFSDNFVP